MSKLQVAYIVSSSYSGSTLLSMLLNTQPDIGTVSEFDSYLDIPRDPLFMCSCGEPIRRCPFFLAVEAGLLDDGRAFSIENISHLLRVYEHPLIDRLSFGSIPYFSKPVMEQWRDKMVALVPGYRRRVTSFYERNEAFMQAILRERGANVFLDANKDPYRMLLLSRNFDVYPVYMYKNGIAGVYSYVKNAKALGMSRTVEQAARRWFREQIGISNALMRFDGEFFQLSYTELCKDVEGTLRRLCAYLGVDFVPVSDLGAVEQHVIGNRMRLQALTEVREDEKWKSNMSAEDIADYRRVYQEFSPSIRRLNETLHGQIWY